jgi:uncharacterized protein (TIGR00255 family)
MLRSMTGYSKSSVAEPGLSVTSSIKSTNHRFLDVQVRLPPGLDVFESLVRRLIKEQVGRGHLEVSITVELDGTAELQINEKLVQAYAAACQKVRDRYGFTAKPDPVSLLRIPGVLVENRLAPMQTDRIRQLVERSVLEATTGLNEMRDREGGILERDLRQRLDHLAALCCGIAETSPRFARLYRERLESRLQEISAAVDIDETRLAQEAAYLVSRSDITEELTRFRSHLEQCRHLLEGDSEAGKKFDFLLQELHREANTILSKTTDVPEAGVEIGSKAIEMKVQIEKLREQVQNIE